MIEAQLQEISPHLTLKISKRAKRIALRLDSKERRVRLVVPQRFNQRRAFDFALKHQHWIREQIANLPEVVSYESGTVLSILGDQVEIDITYDPDAKRTKVELHDDKLSVLTNKEDPTARINRFLKDLAKTALADLASEKADSIGRKITAIQVRDTKSRWGSCGPDGKICFSWRLIFAPYEAMDYVVAHEVAHLVHMDHSKRFWKQCAELCLNYSKGKKWMRTQGHSLLHYGQ